jgi:hypothetical protein
MQDNYINLNTVISSLFLGGIIGVLLPLFGLNIVFLGSSLLSDPNKCQIQFQACWVVIPLPQKKCRNY